MQGIEETVVFIRIYILPGSMILSVVVEDSFALVSRVEFVSAMEGVARNVTIVFTACAVQLSLFAFGFFYLQRLWFSILSEGYGMKRTSIGAH